MSRPVFFLTNKDRLAHFSIETKLLKDRGKIVVEKVATSLLSVDHVKNMVSSFETLDASLKVKGLRIVKAEQLDNNKVCFDFIDGESIERILLNHILQDRQPQSLEIIERVFRIVDALPEVTNNPAQNEDYVAVFGKAFNTTQKCSKIGLVDINLDNFLEKDDTWHLFDYEWCFSFPVPKQMLKARILWYLLVRNREILAFHSGHLSMHSVKNKIFIPDFILSKYAQLFDSVNDLALSEESFQKFVTGKISSNIEYLQEWELVPVPAGSRQFGIDAYVQHEKKHYAKNIEKALNEKHASELKARDERIKTIENSRSYKLARLIQRAAAKLR